MDHPTKEKRMRQLHERIQKETDFKKKIALVKEFERLLDEGTGEKPDPSVPER